MENGGIASRDLIYVEDMARGLIACALRGEAGEVYNLASGVETTIRELAELINELTGNPTPIALTPARDWDHSGQRYGDPNKSRRELGFEATMPLRDGLERTIAWTRENLALIDACIAPRGADGGRRSSAQGRPRERVTHAGRTSRSRSRSSTPDAPSSPCARRRLALPRARLFSRAPRRLVRYKQSAVRRAVGGAPAAPLAAVFSVFLGRLADVPSGTACPTRSSRSRAGHCGCSSRPRSRGRRDSTVPSADLISKVYFPRIVIPLAAVAPAPMDFVIAFVVVLVAMLLYGVVLRPACCWCRCSCRSCCSSRSASGSGSRRSTSLPRRQHRRAVPAPGRAVHHPDHLPVRCPRVAAAALRAQPDGRRAGAATAGAVPRGPVSPAGSSLVPLVGRADRCCYGLPATSRRAERNFADVI